MTRRTTPKNDSFSLKKMILSGEHFFSHNQNKMLKEGDVAGARISFLKKRFNNLDYLLNRRFSWMNDYLSKDHRILEIGVGAGFSELYLKVRPIMTDTIKNEWIDLIINATKMNLPDQSIDVVIASHNLHHFSSPYQFFKECERILKPSGYILIQEINTSLMMRIMLFLMKHEGWSYNVDVFDPNTIANDPRDPWSANCAVPEILFEQTHRFESTFSDLKIIKNEKVEGFIFPLSGGVIAKTKVPEIPSWILDIVYKIDCALIKFFPNIFALGRSVVIQKY